MSIYKKIHEAKLEIGKVTKNSKNPHFKNNYADINALIEAVEPILLEKGLVLLQPIREGKQYTEIHDVESGESVDSWIELPIGTNPQQMGSACTYFRRYTLQGILSLQSEDDDGNKASEPTKAAFTEIHFKNAKEKGATVAQIRDKMTLTPTMEKKYLEFLNMG